MCAVVKASVCFGKRN